MKSLKEKQAKVFESLKDELGLKNVMDTPRIEKIVVNVGTGSRQKKDRFANDFIETLMSRTLTSKYAPVDTTNNLEINIARAAPLIPTSFIFYQ